MTNSPKKKRKGGFCELTGKYSPILEEHHIIPVAYGGKNSPTIKILPELHKAIHASAINPSVREEFLSSITDSELKYKVDKLIQCIIDARNVHEDFVSDDETLKRIVVTLPANLHSKIKEIAKAKGMSMKDVILWCIERAISALF